MSEPVEKVERHFVAVYLRGHESCAVVEVDSRGAALGVVQFVTLTYLMHPLEKRHGAWCVTRDGLTPKIDEAGVANIKTQTILAAFDAREVIGVNSFVRTTDPWEE